MSSGRASIRTIWRTSCSTFPSGRYCRPDEIAEVVRFLATTSASNIQGHNLVVDGGYVIH